MIAESFPKCTVNELRQKFQRHDRPDVLQMWTVYERPRDFPNEFVVREWHVVAGKVISRQAAGALTAPTLEQARKLVPQDCVCMPRQEGDDPVIVETWI